MKRPLAVITGGTSGIGYGIAQGLASEYDLALFYRANDDRANAARRELSAASRCEIFRCDISVEGEIKTAFEKLKRAFDGNPSVLVNSAGVNQEAAFFVLQKDLELYKKIMDVNFFGSLRVISEVLPQMYQNRAGCIINITSVAAEGGFAGYGAYTGSKCALEGFSKNLAIEVAHRNISVNCIRPGFVKTPMTEKFIESTSAEKINYPLQRPIDVSSVTRMAKTLIDAGPNLTGQTITIDGGSTICRRSAT